MVKVLCEMWNYMLNITCYMVPWRVYLFEAHAGCLHRPQTAVATLP